MTVKSLRVLFLGRDDKMNKGKLAYGEDGKLADSPFLSFLIQTDSQNILFDTGMHPDNAAHLNSQGRQITINAEDYLPSRLKEAAGLSLDDIDMVIMSHIHRDHTGWLGHFKNAEVIVQKAEYAAAVIEPTPYYSSYYPLKKYTERNIKWRFVIGDEILMPGLTLLLTPGHTLGHQALMVDLPQTGPIILVGDAVLDLECLEKEIIPGVYADRAESYNTLKKIKVMAKLLNAQVFPSHDIELYLKQMKKLPDYYS